MKRCTSTRTARRRGSRSSPARCRNISIALTHAARRPSGLFRDGGAAVERAAAEARPGRAAPVRRGHHRQHGLGPHARRRHASSAASQRPVRVQPAVASAHAGDHGAGAGRVAGRGGVQFRTALRTVRAWHSRHRAGARRSGRSRRRSCSKRCASSIADRPFVRVGAEMPHIKDVAGSNYAFLSGAANGETDRRDVRDRQSGQGRGRRRDAMAESRVRLRRNDGPQRPRPAGRKRRRTAASTADATIDDTRSRSAMPRSPRAGVCAVSAAK